MQLRISRKRAVFFELDLNHEKTKVLDPSDPIDELWPTELREHSISPIPKQQMRDLAHYFSKAFHIAKERNDENVLVYALKRARSFKVSKSNYLLLESYLLRAARANPRTLPVAAQILINHNTLGFDVTKSKVSKLVQDTINRCSIVGHHGELAWALFLAKGLNINIDLGTIKKVLEVESSVCALITLDLHRMGLVPSNINTKFWKSFMTSDGLYSPMWLLAYEASVKGWLPSPGSHVDNDNFFSVLKQKNVSFYDTKKNVESFKVMQTKAKTAQKTYPSFFITSLASIPF